MQFSLQDATSSITYIHAKREHSVEKFSTHGGLDDRLVRWWENRVVHLLKDRRRYDAEALFREFDCRGTKMRDFLTDYDDDEFSD